MSLPNEPIVGAHLVRSSERTGARLIGLLACAWFVALLIVHGIGR
jgi:hypothetical protein